MKPNARVLLIQCVMFISQCSNNNQYHKVRNSSMNSSRSNIRTNSSNRFVSTSPGNINRSSSSNSNRIVRVTIIAIAIATSIVKANSNSNSSSNSNRYF